MCVENLTSLVALGYFTQSGHVVFKSSTLYDGWVARAVWVEGAIEPTLACQQLEQLLEIPTGARRGNADMTQLGSNLLQAHRQPPLRHPLHTWVVPFQRGLLQAAKGRKGV